MHTLECHCSTWWNLDFWYQCIGWRRKLERSCLELQWLL